MSTVSPFSSLNTAFSGLQAAQAALDVTAKNIASVGVDGYSRQRVQQEAAPGSTGNSWSSAATGVSVAGYERIRDLLLDRRFTDQAPLSGDAEARSSIMTQVEGSFAEPTDYGISSLMNQFWNSWQAAANTPTSTPARQAVIESARSMSDAIRQVSSQLETLRTQISSEQSSRTSEIAQIGTDIAKLNSNIQMTLTHEGSANDLKDQRDALIDKLASYGNLTVTNYDSGLSDITFGTFSLVTGATSSAPTLANLNTAATGRMFALEDMRSNVIPGLASNLDSVAVAIIGQVNAQHALGFDLNGVIGGNVFSGTGANDIGLNATWAGSPAKLALSSSSTAAGNNSNGLALSGIGDLAATVGGSQSINGAYGSLVSQVGSLTKQAKAKEQLQNSLTDAVQNKRSGVSGVSLDEEMGNLIRYQQSYGAAARVISAIDQMLDILVNRTGKVGM